MKTRKRLTERQQVTIAIAFTVLFYLAIGIFIYSRFHTKSVRPGISLDDAKKIVDENEGYYIIQEDGSTVIEFYVTYGDDERFEVDLKGNHPLRYLSRIFFISKRNSFLIKGKVYDEQYKGRELFNEGDPLPYIEVESWEIITPIGRDYTYEHHERYLYPTDYLDQYDVDHGDYAPEGWK